MFALTNGILVLALFTGSFAIPILEQKDTCSSAQQNAVIQCYTSFFATFNLSVNPFPEYNVFKQAVGQLVVKGLKGQRQYCDYQNSLVACLSSYEASCVNTASFETIFGINVTEASEYQTYYYIMKYECGTGYNDLTKNFYCFQNVENYHLNEVQACIKQEQQGMSHGFNCTIYDQYIDCLTGVYVKYCGQGVYHFICTVEEIGIQSNTHYCDPGLPNCDKKSIKKWL